MMGPFSSFERIYLDYAATAPLRPEARDALLEALDNFGNASSVHGEGQRARAMLDEARRLVAGVLGVRPERVVFTSGGTEGNNLVLRGFRGGKMLVSAVEHDCVLNTALALGAEVIPVRQSGVVDMGWLQERLAQGGIGLVSVMHANNETGVLQPVREVAALCRMAGAAFHTDAVQTVGHIPVKADELEADALTFSAHKFGGPKGVGAVVLKPELKLEASITGGAQERRRRAGTENVAGIYAMAVALKVAAEKMEGEAKAARAMGRKVLEGCQGLRGAGARVEVVAEGSERVPHIVQLRTPGRRGEDVVIGMDMRGVAVSQGSACSSGRVQASHVLQAMGFDEEAAGEGVRLSWGWASEEGDAARAMEVLAALVG